MIMYWVSLFQERPLLTMCIFFSVITVLVYIVRAIVIAFVDEATLLREYLSDEDDNTILVPSCDDFYLDDEEDYVRVVLKKREFFTLYSLFDITKRLDCFGFVFVPDKDTNKKILVTRFNLLSVEQPYLSIKMKNEVNYE